jgi:glycosyltransferase involved in cell wall biosynthesis
MTARSIAHLTTFLQGGAGRAIVDLAIAQRVACHDVLVMTSATGVPGYGNYAHYLEELAAAGVGLVQEDSLFKRDEALNWRALERLRRERPDGIDVIHAHAGVPAAIGLRYARTVRQVPAVIQTQHGWGTSKTAGQARNDIATLNAVDRVVATSDATRTRLHDLGVRSGHIDVIPCGISSVCPGNPPEEAVRLASRMRVSSRRVVGCIGSIAPNKNQALLLRALMHAEAADIAAIFVGEGQESLLALARTLALTDRVAAVGYQPDASRWLPVFDALVVPSLTEGQGLVVLEAFRAGVPVIASDIPALGQTVAHGKTGWLFPSSDARALAQAVAHVVHLPSRDHSRVTDSARRAFLSRYTVDAMVARHEALYDTLTGDLLPAPTERRSPPVSAP